MTDSASRARDWPGVAMTTVAATMFAFKGVLAKLVFMEGVGLAVLLLVRFSLAIPIFWAGLKNMMDIRDLSLIDRRGWLYCILAGGCYFASVYADFKAIELIPVGVERLLFFSYPIFLIVLSALLLRLPPTRRQMGGMVVIQAGLVLIVGILDSPIVSFTSHMWTGVAFAMLAALAYAIFLLLAQMATRRLGSVAFTVLANSVTFLAIAVWYGAGHTLTEVEMSWRAFAYISAIAVFCTVVPFFMLFEGIRRIGSTPAALISTTGPIVTVLAAVVILGESLSNIQLVGMALVLGGVVWLETGASRIHANIR